MGRDDDDKESRERAWVREGCAGEGEGVRVVDARTLGESRAGAIDAIDTMVEGRRRGECSVVGALVHHSGGRRLGQSAVPLGKRTAAGERLCTTAAARCSAPGGGQQGA